MAESDPPWKLSLMAPIQHKKCHQVFSESEETQKGHMQGQRQGVCSAKKAESPDKNQTIILHVKKHDILILVYNAKATMYSDQTGKFSAVSSKGNKYVMVLHDVDSNSSWAEPMKNQTGGELILARNWALTKMQQQGINPKHQILDNQASESYKDAIRALGMPYKLVPPNDHRRNMAEKAIQTFKDHFIEVLSRCAVTMPIHLWCQLLPQTKRQLLLLRQLRLHPNLSAYAHDYEQHDYNKHPFVPIGMEAMVHDKPHKPRTFAKHCSRAFVLSTFTEHCQCWKFWMVSMRATRISGTASFKHKYLTNPSVTPKDQITVAAAHLTNAIQGTIAANMHTSTLKSLSNLQSIFHDTAKGYNTNQSGSQ
jgi:hypothetical protein